MSDPQPRKYCVVVVTKVADVAAFDWRRDYIYFKAYTAEDALTQVRLTLQWNQSIVSVGPAE